MVTEVIPFNTFMSIAPSASTLAWVDYGLTFFAGTGVALLALVVAEKMGFNINKAAVRWTVRVTAFILVLWMVFTSGFLSHVLFGW
jgi:hypothetical protein